MVTGKNIYKDVSQKGLKIILVDDSDADFHLLKALIDQLPIDNIQLDFEHNYKKAVERISTGSYDICFVDYTLGMKSGFDLIKELNQLDFNAPPYILLTSFDRPDLYQDAFELNIFNYYLKDELTITLLLRTILNALERKKVETELTQEKIFSSNIIESSPDIVLILNDNNIVISANSAAHKYFHTNSDTLNYNIQHYVPFSDDDILNLRRDGTRNPIQLNQDNLGNIFEWTSYATGETHTVFIGRNVTQQVLQEQQDKMIALGHLSSGVAHEMNNLLQPILSNAEFMIDNNDFDDIQDLAQDIVDTALIAAKIVNDILLFARERTHNPTPTPIAQQIDDCLSRLSKKTPDGITLNIDNQINGQDFVTYATFVDLNRVFENLVSNACQAYDDTGDVKISIYPSASPEGINFIHITIQDFGYGILEENLKQIFNPFFTTKNPGEGTGLGLSIVHNIVKEWNGHINIDSKIGEGTTVSILIPTI